MATFGARAAAVAAGSRIYHQLLADASTRLAEAFRHGLNETGVFHGLIRMYDAYRPAEGVCSLVDRVDPRPAAEAAYAARASSA